MFGLLRYVVKQHMQKQKASDLVKGLNNYLNLIRIIYDDFH
jgi:hypothetical protein